MKYLFSFYYCCCQLLSSNQFVLLCYQLGKVFSWKGYRYLPRCNRKIFIRNVWNISVLGSLVLLCTVFLLCTLCRCLKGCTQSMKLWHKVHREQSKTVTSIWTWQLDIRWDNILRNKHCTVAGNKLLSKWKTLKRRLPDKQIMQRLIEFCHSSLRHLALATVRHRFDAPFICISVFFFPIKMK